MMPPTRRYGPKPRVISATADQIAELRRRASGRTTTVRDAQRAKILLKLLDGQGPGAVARDVGVDVKTVRTWRARFILRGIDGLEELDRSGRPETVPLAVRYEVIEMACGKPIDFGVPFRDIWTLESLASALLNRHPELNKFDGSTVLRILTRADVRPHHEEQWLHSPDPAFREKATAICEVYRGLPPGAVLFCVDEKTGMQALGRPYPVRPAAPHRPGRRDANYIRHGSRVMIAAFNPQSGEVISRVSQHRAADDLMALMEEIALRYPDVEIYIVWDNLNTHHDGPADRWTTFNLRHGGRFHFLYTPIHASWVNQVEAWFGILHRRVLRHGVFESVEDLERRLAGFVDYWNRSERHAFRWKFKGYPLDYMKNAA
jgi:transposase